MTHPFTPTYISMAKAAEEIQAMRGNPRSWQMGDFSIREVYGESSDGIATPMVQCMGGTEFDGLDFPASDAPLAFLPRLDQLLGMLGGPSAWHALHLDIEGDAWSDFPGVNDWHELALSVVMWEKFGKVWREGKWVKA